MKINDYHITGNVRVERSNILGYIFGSSSSHLIGCFLPFTP